MPLGAGRMGAGNIPEIEALGRALRRNLSRPLISAWGFWSVSACW
jgi:hypothetical protein